MTLPDKGVDSVGILILHRQTGWEVMSHDFLLTLHIINWLQFHCRMMIINKSSSQQQLELQSMAKIVATYTLFHL